MIQVLLIILISTAIFFLVYQTSNEKQFTKATVCACLVAVLGFVGPYIVDSVGNFGEDCKVGNFGEEGNVGNTDDSLSNHEHESDSQVKENIINATCFYEGSYDLVSYCRCGKELSRDVVTVEALGHYYIGDVIEPSCENSGYTTYTCIRCKDSYVDDYTEALGHDFVEEKCTRCDVVSSEYEPLIISRANELINAGDYDEAFNIVSKALDIISSDSLQQLLNNIQAMQEKDLRYTAKSVEFITYNGCISGSDQTVPYSLYAPVTGNYRFDVSNMVSGFSVKLHICDSNGKVIKEDLGLGNGSGVTCELVQGNSYTVEVISYSNTGTYTLTIGQHKEMVDITEKKVICDSIEYIGQQNEYTFVPSIDGSYRFDFSDIVNGFEVKCFISDSLGYDVGGNLGLGNGSGVTVELISNEKYTVKVIQYSNAGTYTMTIGKQQVTKDITGKSSITDDISYKDQKNIYTYTPPSTGKYMLSLHKMVKGFSIKLYVYDSLGHDVGGYIGLENDSMVPVELKEGETYTIHLIQDSNMGSYDMNIFCQEG